MRRLQALPREHTSSPTQQDGKPEVILMGTGSEVSLCVSAYETTENRGHQSPSGEHALVGICLIVKAMSTRPSVLPPEVKARVAVEAGRNLRLVAVCWSKRHGDRNASIRSLRSDQGFAKEVRVHHRQRGRGGPKSNWKITDVSCQSSVVGRQENRLRFC